MPLEEKQNLLEMISQLERLNRIASILEVEVDKLQVKVFRLIILMRDSLILTIHGDEVVRLVKFSRYADTFMRDRE
jgi:hypothetical protein